LNPRPSLQIRIEAKPLECRFTIFQGFLGSWSVRTLIEAEVAQAVADAADLAERGGRSSGIHIGERRFHLEGR
jgi:hypothetical protein